MCFSFSASCCFELGHQSFGIAVMHGSISLPPIARMTAPWLFEIKPSSCPAGQAEAMEKQALALAGHKGSEAAALTVAREYVAAFKSMAQSSNTILLPANAGDAPSMVATAMAVFNSVSKSG